MGGKNKFTKCLHLSVTVSIVKLLQVPKAALTFEKRKAGGPMSSGLIHGKGAEVA